MTQRIQDTATIAAERRLVPTRTETAVAEAAVGRGLVGRPTIRRSLDAQEERSRSRPADRPGLLDVLGAAGALDAPALARLQAALERRRAQSRERRFARVLVAAGLAGPDRVRRLLAEYRRAAAAGLVHHFDDHLVTRGVLARDIRDQVLMAHVRSEFRPEDDLYARTALAAGLVSAIAVRAALARQEDAVASGRAPLPLSSILVALGAIAKPKSDAVLRAVRRHRITGDPIRRDLG